MHSIGYPIHQPFFVEIRVCCETLLPLLAWLKCVAGALTIYALRTVTLMSAIINEHVVIMDLGFRQTSRSWHCNSSTRSLAPHSPTQLRSPGDPTFSVGYITSCLLREKILRVEKLLQLFAARLTPCLAQVLSFLDLTSASATKLIKIYQLTSSKSAGDYVLKR